MLVGDLNFQAVGPRANEEQELAGLLYSVLARLGGALCDGLRITRRTGGQRRSWPTARDSQEVLFDAIIWCSSARSCVFGSSGLWR